MHNAFTGVSSNSSRCVASLRLCVQVLSFLSFPKRPSRIIIRPIAFLTHAIYSLQPNPSVSQELELDLAGLTSVSANLRALQGGASFLGRPPGT